jgi:hypothetical protein
MPAVEEKGTNWQEVTGRSLAYISLYLSDKKDGSLTTKANFLKGLGLSTADAAGVLGTTAASLNELFRQKRNKKGGNRLGGKKK